MIAINLASEKWTQIKSDKSHVSNGLCPLRKEQRSPVRAVDLVRANCTEQQITVVNVSMHRQKLNVSMHRQKLVSPYKLSRYI